MGPTTDAASRAVTVCHGTRRVDVWLPAAVPVAELMPGLLDLAHAHPDDRPETPKATRTWGLAPIGREPLAWEHSLAEAGVADGDLLILTDNSRPTSGVEVYDVADEASVRVDLLGPRFGVPQALVAWLATAALAGIVATVVAFAGAGVHPVALAVAAVALAAGAAVHRVRPLPDTVAGQITANGVVVAAVGCAVAAVAAWLDTQSGAGVAAAAAGVAIAVGVVVAVASEQRLVGALVVAAGLLTVLTAALDVLGVNATQAALAIGAVSFASIEFAPRIAVTVGGMTTLDVLARAGKAPDDATVASTTERCDQYLTGLIAAGAAGTALAAVALAAGSPAAVVVAGLFGAGLVIQAQHLSRPTHRLVVRLPALTALALLPAIAGLSASVMVATAVVVPLGIFAGLLWAPWPASVAAWARQLGGWVEGAVIIGLVPAITTAAGFFGWLSDAL